MEYRQLNGSGLFVPALSLGTATFGGTHGFEGWGNTGVAEATRMVDMCLEAGLNLFDTADIYSRGLSEEILGKAISGKRNRLLIDLGLTLIDTAEMYADGGAEEVVGEALRGRRNRVTLVSKVYPWNAGGQKMQVACEASLRRLGTDHIDIYYMHGFDGATPLEETLSALDNLVQSGKVRYIGCSNFSGWQLMKSLAVSNTVGHVM